jgi:hypothetical protein
MTDSFPRNLAYSIRSLAGFSKSVCKLTPDKYNDVKSTETIRVKLPPNSLIDLRTLTMFADVSTSSTAGKCHIPAYSSSLIEQLNVYINGTMVENISQYNVLYNTLYSLDGGGIDQVSKRFLENVDPSVDYAVSATGVMSVSSKTDGAADNDTKKKIAINNWIGMLNSLSTPVIDTNDTSDIILEIRFANSKVLWQSGDTALTGADFKLDDIRFTISKIVFNEPTYYNYKARQLLGSGLMLGYNTYISNKGSEVSKASSLSYTINVNSTSLDQVIATFHTDGYQSWDNLKLSAGATASTTPYSVAAATATTTDFFNQSKYFQRDAIGLTGSSFEINNVMMDPYPLPIEEVYNTALISLGNLNIDMASGVSPGCSSLAAFKKYYFAHILSLENISTDSAFYKSGLDGRANSMTITYKTQFTTTQKCTPMLFCKTTRMLQINEGHQVTVIV